MAVNHREAVSRPHTNIGVVSEETVEACGEESMQLGVETAEGLRLSADTEG